MCRELTIIFPAPSEGLPRKLTDFANSVLNHFASIHARCVYRKPYSS